jgi:hypothetical protein
MSWGGPRREDEESKGEVRPFQSSEEASEQAEYDVSNGHSYRDTLNRWFKIGIGARTSSI